MEANEVCVLVEIVTNIVQIENKSNNEEMIASHLSTSWYLQLLVYAVLQFVCSLLFTRPLCTAPDTTTKASHFALHIHQHVQLMFCRFTAFHYPSFCHILQQNRLKTCYKSGFDSSLKPFLKPFWNRFNKCSCECAGFMLPCQRGLRVLWRVRLQLKQ